MNGQQAPVDFKQASRLSPFHVASMIKKRSNGGTTTKINAALNMVIAILNQLEKRFWRAHPIKPRIPKGGGAL
jgi:hypothetical protein